MSESRDREMGRIGPDGRVDRGAGSLEPGEDPGSGGEPPRRRSSLGAIKEFVLGLPRFMGLLYGLMRDPRVSALDRALFGATFVYLFTPVDVIPDWIPVLGQVDDVILVLVTLDRLLYRTDEAILLDHWEGDPGPLLTLRDLLDRAVDVLPGWVRGLIRAG